MITSSTTFGPFGIAEQLNRRLVEYIGSSYPLRDEVLIAERERLLKLPGVISQEPRLEITPDYASGPRIEDLDLPTGAAKVLSTLAARDPSLGIHNPPYAHQAAAFHAFLTERADIMVSSGTGSGKTETFLHPILAELAREATERPNRFAQPGVRALILYPMNALVGDQLARL